MLLTSISLKLSQTKGCYSNNIVSLIIKKNNPIMAIVTSINPYSGKDLKTYTTHANKEVTTILKSANKQFLLWKNSPIAQRGVMLKNAGKELLKNKQEYAKMISNEMGKPISQAISEVEKCALVCDFYADNAEKQLATEYIKTDAFKSYITYEPLGVVLAIMPWNYPFWQVFRFAAPALMAGNVAVLKHASNVFGSALMIQKVFERAGFPEACFTTLLVESDAIEAIIKNPIIKAVTLTGSESAGASVASIAGQYIKKTVLELGGSNALIIFKDANIDKAIATCVQARFQNTGQSCIAGKRLLIDASIAENFIAKLVFKVRKLKSGNPIDASTYIGVMAREDLAIELEKQVEKSVKQGAKIVLGGKRQGTYFEPTILVNVNENASVFQEETFGPVLSVTTFKTEEEAILLSNTSKFGLGVSLFSENLEKMEQILSKFEDGAVFINELVKSDPRLPFGGIKASGYGRELSKEGIREFVNVKTVYIKK